MPSITVSDNKDIRTLSKFYIDLRDELHNLKEVKQGKAQAKKVHSSAKAGNGETAVYLKGDPPHKLSRGKSFQVQLVKCAALQVKDINDIQKIASFLLKVCEFCVPESTFFYINDIEDCKIYGCEYAKDPNGSDDIIALLKAFAFSSSERMPVSEKMLLPVASDFIHYRGVVLTEVKKEDWVTKAKIITQEKRVIASMSYDALRQFLSKTIDLKQVELLTAHTIHNLVKWTLYAAAHVQNFNEESSELLGRSWGLTADVGYFVDLLAGKKPLEKKELLPLIQIRHNSKDNSLQLFDVRSSILSRIDGFDACRSSYVELVSTILAAKKDSDDRFILRDVTNARSNQLFKAYGAPIGKTSFAVMEFISAEELKREPLQYTDRLRDLQLLELSLIWQCSKSGISQSAMEKLYPLISYDHAIPFTDIHSKDRLLALRENLLQLKTFEGASDLILTLYFDQSEGYVQVVVNKDQVAFSSVENHAAKAFSRQLFQSLKVLLLDNSINDPFSLHAIVFSLLQKTKATSEELLCMNLQNLKLEQEDQVEKKVLVQRAESRRNFVTKGAGKDGLVIKLKVKRSEDISDGPREMVATVALPDKAKALANALDKLIESDFKGIDEQWRSLSVENTLVLLDCIKGKQRGYDKLKGTQVNNPRITPYVVL